MANYNRVLLMGNLTRDPELRYIPSGSAVVNLRLAVNRTYKNQSGESKEEVTFVNVVVWGKQAENCSEYLAKGRPIFVEGRLQSRQWETDDGQKRSVLEVVADRVQFLGKRSDGDSGRSSGDSERSSGDSERSSGDSERGRGTGEGGAQPVSSGDAGNEDDIPF